jgi:CubicO group peptidase (beta-lactamase class C family)
MPCTQLLVARYGKVCLRSAYGMADEAAGAALGQDGLFRIYSMTKPLTCVAALVCYERGYFELDDPVGGQGAADRGFRGLT